MGWRERLKPASFRGISFFVEGSNVDGGRRVVERDFPGRNISYIEDVGRATRHYKVTAYILGDDYDRQRDALQAALEKPGLGDLVHPYYGTVKVRQSGKYSIKERSQDGGIAVFDLEFAESEEPTQPEIVLDTTTNIFDKVNNALDAATDIFDNVFSMFQKAQRIVDDVSKTANNAAVALQTIKSNGKKALDFQNNINNLINNIGTLIYETTTLHEIYTDLFTGDDSIFGVIENLKLKDFQKDLFLTEENNQALTTLIQQLAVFGAAKAVTGVEFTSSTEADEVLQLVSTALDELMETAPIDIYVAAWELRIAVIDDINARTAELPVIVEMQLTDSLPSLFLAYDLYEDMDRAPEIVERNNVVHPGFLPGGATIEVLSRE